MSQKPRTMYLPTVYGRPARFCEDYQLCIGGGRRFYVEPLTSLRAVRRQIAESKKNRSADGFNDDEPNKYGYVRIKVSR